MPCNLDCFRIVQGFKSLQQIATTPDGALCPFPYPKRRRLCPLSRPLKVSWTRIREGQEEGNEVARTKNGVRQGCWGGWVWYPQSLGLRGGQEQGSHNPYCEPLYHCGPSHLLRIWPRIPDTVFALASAFWGLCRLFPGPCYLEQRTV